MFTRESLNEMEMSKIQQDLQADLMNFHAQLEQLTIEQLNEEETKLITEMDEYDKYLNNVNYKLPAETTFDNQKYMKAAVANKIVDFIERMELEWQYTLGMYQLVKLWNNIGDKIEYRAYDSTLRVLGQVRYKGFADWEGVQIVNDYLSKVQDEYAKDNIYVAYLAEMHNAILNRLNPKNAPIPEVVNE